MTESLFRRYRANFLEVAYFNELAEDDEVTPTRPRGVPLQMWEDLEYQKPLSNNSAHTSMGQTGPTKHNKSSNNKTRRGHDLPKKVRLADGSTTYLFVMFWGVMFFIKA